MSFNLRWDVECALRAALPEIKRHLDYADLVFEGDDEALLAALASGLVPSLRAVLDRDPEPLPRHEECPECDALILVHQGRSSWSDPEDEEGAWHTHCTVCLEEWPCPDAGEPDEDEVEALQNRYHRLLRAFNAGDRSNYTALRQLRRRLEAENRLPPSEEDK